MLKVLTVCRSGGDYNEGHVNKIIDMCKRNITIPYSFHCLSDIEIKNAETIKLTAGLSGWFSKMELFKISGPCLYLDLDTVVTDNIDDIITECINSESELITLNDVYLKQDFIQSSLMFWKGNLEFIYDIFFKNQDLYSDPKFVFKEIVQRQQLGDQNIIYKICKEQKTCYSFFPQQGDSIVSFKADVLDRNLKNHKIVYFHGPPRPWEQNLVPY